MADPRNIVEFDGVDGRYASYKIDNSTITYDSTKENGSSQVGLAVTLSTDDTIKLAEDGNAILGRLIQVESDDKALVQYEGYMTLPGGNGASLTIGKKIVGALGAASAKGYIREVATATAAELGVARGFIQNNDTTTAVLVCL